MYSFLLVEDSQFMRDKLKEFIEVELGHKVIGEAENGEEGIAKYKELKPDFVALDICMPVLTGRDALIQLIDYDPASNYGNWMYIAGVGHDPRPFRKFNTQGQAERYDKEGTYRKLWLR